jgi:hypothetical protein
MTDGLRVLDAWSDGSAEHRTWGPAAKGADIWLRMTVEPTELRVSGPAEKEYDMLAMHRLIEPRARFFYSLDGIGYEPIGETFVGSAGRWTGAQIGLFATAPFGTQAATATSVGEACFDWFHVGSRPQTEAAR